MLHYWSKPWCRATRVLAKGEEENESENFKDEEFGDYEENDSLYENSRKDVAQ